jgi:hypothetical protein
MRKHLAILVGDQPTTPPSSPSLPRPIKGRRLLDEAPVEIMRDGLGIYGVGVSDSFDHEAIALRCGVDDRDTFPPTVVIPRSPPPLILRPDRLGDHRGFGAALQMITGRRNGPFKYTLEEQLRQFVHQEALHRAGLPGDDGDRQYPWWSTSKPEQQRNRKIYHGLRRLSLTVINRLVSEAIEAAAPPDAIKTARRFHLRHREVVYRAAARSHRVMQLANVFPFAALCIYGDHDWTYLDLEQFGGGDFLNDGPHKRAIAARRNAASVLIERGARLREVAAALGIPVAFRQVKPRAAHLVRGWMLDRPDLLRWLPETTQEQRIWLQLVHYIKVRCKDPEFAEWVAKYVTEIPGRTLTARGDAVVNLCDWARSRHGQGFAGGRPFVPSMSVRTVTTLSAEWHVVVATIKDESEGPFPEPWLPGGTIGKYEIVPLTCNLDLHAEATAMHHCVGTYGERVRAGYAYVYSVRESNERLATISITGHHQNYHIEQIRSHCNQPASPAVERAVRSWLKSHNRGASQ